MVQCVGNKPPPWPFPPTDVATNMKTLAHVRNGAVRPIGRRCDLATRGACRGHDALHACPAQQMATRQELHRLLERAQTHNACEVLYRHRDMFEISVAYAISAGERRVGGVRAWSVVTGAVGTTSSPGCARDLTVGPRSDIDIFCSRSNEIPF